MQGGPSCCIESTLLGESSSVHGALRWRDQTELLNMPAALDLKGDAWRQLLNCAARPDATRTPAVAAVLGPQRTSNI